MSSMMINIENMNPDKKPLDQLYFPIKDNGVVVKIPALSKHWISPRAHTKYRPLPIVDGKILNTVALDEWLQETDWFYKEMDWLLRLDHFRFWSYMVYDPGCITSVISFLQEATPFFTPIPSLTSDYRVLTLYKDILDNVITIICRMVTNRESETEWITKEHLADLLYSKYLISIPMIFDIIIAYGRTNSILLTRLLKTIFTIEPKFKEDCRSALQFLKTAFDIVQQKLDENDAKTSFDDLAIYTLDCSATLAILLELYPEINQLCLDIKLEQSITNFYDATLPLLFKQIYVINPFAPSLKYLSQARIDLLASFRSIANVYMEKILTNPSDSLIPAEHFLALLQEALSDHVFVVDYQRMYPIHNDVETLKQACSDLDMFKVDFIVQAYSSEDEEIQKMIAESVNNSNKYSDDDDEAAEGASALPIPVIDQQIQNVIDVLPHLEPNFVRKLLQRYENTELAIAAVLEGNLPPDLEDTEVTPINEVDQITNVLDDIDFSRNGEPAIVIKTGKGFPGQAKNLKTLLDDKSHVKSLKTRYQEYSLVPEHEYDDEYDDSFEAMADSEAKTIKNVRNTVAQNIIADELSDYEETDEDDAQTYRDRTKDFCENPEMVRERYARNRNNKYAASAPNKPPKTSNVVGKPKGQGQDTSTQQNRHKKDVQKSARANHNRRQGAAFKRNKGMIPS